MAGEITTVVSRAGVIIPALFAPDRPTARRFLEFFAARLRNDNTRMAYVRAVDEFAQWCDRAGCDHFDPLRRLLHEIRNSERMDFGRNIGRSCGFAQECYLLGVALNQVHAGLRRVRQCAGDRHAGKASPGAEIGPDPRMRRQREDLQRIGDMAGP